MSVPEQMIYGIMPKQSEIAGAYPYVQYSGSDRFLSPPECNEIIRIMEEEELGVGSVGTSNQYGSRIDTDYRSVFTGSLDPERFAWLYERILQRISWVNDSHFQYEISGIGEKIQYLLYREPTEETNGVSGRYKWHTDYGPGVASMRKLSCVIQLSDPSEYEGCRLSIFDCVSPVLEVPEIGQGDMVVFPSYTPHMVSDLISGTRRALALWVSGPTFR